MEQAESLRIMKEKAAAVQTVMAEVKGLREAFQYAVDVTLKQGGSTIAAPGFKGKDRSDMKALCKKNGLQLLTENLRVHIGGIDTGFTQAERGISETATLVVDSGSEDLRIATMLCETHIAVLAESRIVPDVVALEEELGRMLKSSSNYLAFISGASRTADIERVLTIGVHGPQELHIVILKDDHS